MNENETIMEQTPTTANSSKLTEEVLDDKIPVLNSFEDFALCLSGVFDASEVYHLDVMINALPVWGNQVTEENISLLEPAFKIALEGVINQKRRLGNITLGLIFAYMEYVESKYSGKFEALDELKSQALKIDEESARGSIAYKRYLMPFEDRVVPYGFTGFWKIGVYAIEKMRHNDLLPLLSTPTHLPIWIDSVVLVNRLISYQENGREPHDMDMQLALQRCTLSDTVEALDLVKSKLNGEIKNLMLFLLDPKARPKRMKDHHPAWWRTAEITRAPGKQLCTAYTWEMYTKPTKSGKFGYPEHQAIRINAPQYNKDEQPYELFMEYALSIQDDHLYYARPHLLDDAYAFIIKEVKTLAFSWDKEPSFAMHYAKILRKFHTPFREMHYLLLTVCILGPHETLREYGAQIWQDRIGNGTIDNARLGKMIGNMEAVAAAPLKHFTDILESGMMGISQLHNRAALELVEITLSQYRVIGGAGKLLEIYNKLLALNQENAEIEG